MSPLIDAPVASAALFHSRAGGFPLLLCSYVLLDAGSNDPDDIRRFLVAVDRLVNEMTP